MNNIIILGNKGYNHIKLNDIINNFDFNIRCNMAVPYRNNGTKFFRYFLNVHVYDNFISNPKSKNDIIKIYASHCKVEDIKKYYDFLHENKNKIKFIKQNNISYDNFLKNLGCPYSVNKNKKVASCGYNAIFETIKNNTKPFIFGYGLNVSERCSFYHNNNSKMNNSITRAPCHNEQEEINILKWLHNNNNVDATMCTLEDRELPTFDCNSIKPKPDILLLFLQKYGIVILENFYPETILNKIIYETDMIFNTYKDKIEILDKENCSNDERIFHVERYSSYIKNIFSYHDLFNCIASKYTQKALNNKKTLLNKVVYEDGKIKNSGAGWHRDNHDCQFKVIMYLSDVTEKNGNFQFITNSSKRHIGKPKPRTKNYDTRFHDDTIEQLLKDNNSCKLHNIIGNKGTIIIADTTYIHRGNIIEEGIRTAITEYFI